MLIGCFCGMVDWRKCACLIFSGDYYQVSNKILFYWLEMCSDHNKYNTMSQSLALKNLFNHSLPSSEFFAFPENCCWNSETVARRSSAKKTVLKIFVKLSGRQPYRSFCLKKVLGQFTTLLKMWLQHKCLSVNFT